MIVKLKGIEAKWLAAFISCLLMMVQGDVTAATFGHWLVAGSTATVASIIFISMLYAPKMAAFASSRGGSAASFGGGVFISDSVVCPSSFGFIGAEAFSTALMSAVLAYLAHDYLAKE
jgi:hypothetical protein